MSYEALQRNIRNGLEYNALIPKSKCEKVNFGKGDTFFSIDKIIVQILQHNAQMAKVAKVLQQNTLLETCKAIHQFAYWHFQYRGDGEAQILRSPACSWQQRYIGIDCKSQSIVISSILVQQGVKHYIRKIKQPMFNPEQFTHVYVIVPINQQSGSLNQGYYTVDGTIATMQEPTKTFKKDFFMDQLPHYGMNGVFDSVTGGQSNPKLDAAIDVAKRFDFKKISSQMSEKFKSFSLSLPIKCWGGVGFDTNAYMIHQNIINQFIHDLIIKANQAVEINDMAEVKKIAELFSFFPSALWQNFRLLTTQGYNACSRDNMMQIMVMAEHMAKVQVAFNAWLLNYTTQTQLGAISFKVTDIARLLNFQPAAHPNIPDLQGTAFNYNLKPSTTAFTPFVYNDYIRTLPTGNAFDIKQYIGTIKDVVPIFLLNVLGGGTKTEKEEYIKNNPVKTGKTDKAGGGVLGWVIGLTALGLAISQFTGKPKTATKTVATNNNKK